MNQNKSQAKYIYAWFGTSTSKINVNRARTRRSKQTNWQPSNVRTVGYTLSHILHAYNHMLCENPYKTQTQLILTSCVAIKPFILYSSFWFFFVSFPLLEYSLKNYNICRSSCSWLLFISRLWAWAWVCVSKMVCAIENNNYNWNCTPFVDRRWNGLVKSD